MKNIWRERRKRKLRESCRAVSATPLIETALGLVKDGTKKERKEFVAALKRGYQKAGEELTQLALLENLLTQKDFDDFEKRGFTKGDLTPVIQGMMNMRDHPDDTAIVITSEDSVNYKHRAWIKRRFGVKVLGTKRALEMMKKQLKEKK